jgi:hypothetical protein
MNCTNPLTVKDKFKTKICKLHLKNKKGDNTSRNGTKQTKEQII